MMTVQAELPVFCPRLQCCPSYWPRWRCCPRCHTVASELQSHQLLQVHGSYLWCTRTGSRVTLSQLSETQKSYRTILNHHYWMNITPYSNSKAGGWEKGREPGWIIAGHGWSLFNCKCMLNPWSPLNDWFCSLSFRKGHYEWIWLLFVSSLFVGGG